jgi:hypothetical protein
MSRWASLNDVYHSCHQVGRCLRFCRSRRSKHRPWIIICGFSVRFNPLHAVRHPDRISHLVLYGCRIRCHCRNFSLTCARAVAKPLAKRQWLGRIGIAGDLRRSFRLACSTYPDSQPPGHPIGTRLARSLGNLPYLFVKTLLGENVTMQNARKREWSRFRPTRKIVRLAHGC